MKKGSGTRSGLLWEVERLLNECGDNLPHVLLMENVPQVIGEKNKADFDEWCRFLESKGYSNYYQLLNAKDYGIPQNRNRCFMVSILGDYYYEFPKPMPLKLKLKDMLETNVDEKYYLNDKMIKYILNRTPIGDKGNFANNLIGSDLIKNAGTLTTKNSENGSSVRGEDTLLVENMTQDEIDEKIYLKVKNATKKGYLLAKDGDGIDISSRMESHRGTVQIDMAQTLLGASNVGVVVKNEPKVIGGIGEKKSNNGTQWYQQDRIYEDNIALSLATGFNPYYLSDLRIRKLTPCECWALMGFSREDYLKASKVNSANQLYKQAGNSIVVNVLMAIFKEML